PADFEAWRRNQLQTAPTPATPIAAAGEKVFVAHCASCHTVRGAGARGWGPDLTHLMSRRTIAAGLLVNTPGNLSGWISDAQGLKPGAKMPMTYLSGPQLTAVRGYLETLK
ncbi:MAG: cytochrome c, partial [Caulobacteraceae bacterium]